MRRLWLGMLIVLTLTGLVGCSLTDAPQIRVILTGEHRVPSGQSETALVGLIDGELIVEPDGELSGDLYLVGGTMSVRGRVTGDIVLFGGTLDLADDARVAGSIDIVGGTLRQSADARVTGSIQRVVQVPRDVAGRSGTLAERWPRLLVELMGLGLLALVSARFLPRPVGRVADAVRRQPVVMGSVGVLSFVVALVLLVLIGFTIVLIPLALAGVLALGLVVAWGLVGLGAIAGQLLQVRLRRELSGIWTTVLGTVGLGLGLELINAVPIVGGLIAILILSVGFGAVLLTRLGLQAYVPRVPWDEEF